MLYREITPADNAPLAALIRRSLKAHGLDIPGTVYFDENLDHLSDFYLGDPATRVYIILDDGNGQVMGGIGLAAFPGLPGCAELQKLYLVDAAKGAGLGMEMIRLVEDRAKDLGYRRMYLETHTNLAAAIHIYEKSGYARIEQPESVVHSTMNRFYIKELI